MAGYNWSFQQFTGYLKHLPWAPKTLNPLIEQLMKACPDSCVFALGGHSVILWLSPEIVAKVPLQEGDERLLHEHQMFELLSPLECAHIIQCHLSRPNISFLELVPNGTLHDRICMVDEPRPVLRWMLQMASAAAAFEAVGYAHGDINPQNILLDNDDNLKLIDFDHALRIGEALDVGYEPYVRQHRDPSGGQFGRAGPVTDQFALGSVFWYMSRGSELYSELDGPDQVDRMLDGIFPAVNVDDPVDCIIQKCWAGQYPRVADLVEAIESVMGGSAMAHSVVISTQKAELRRTCEMWYSQAIQRLRNL
ncbi:hypothetical protein K4F52_003529 [Lecanicillium sp. MT-2017a]|nr:hypothetical protein K4F52_003529 [Lecanicillium sp. MT-2017a]